MDYYFIESNPDSVLFVEDAQKQTVYHEDCTLKHKACLISVETSQMNSKSKKQTDFTYLFIVFYHVRYI